MSKKMEPLYVTAPVESDNDVIHTSSHAGQEFEYVLEGTLKLVMGGKGFIGSTAVLVLFALFILRLMSLAERQNDRFGRVYGYSLASIFFFHFTINIGMVLGIMPVIGIPLPFFSYGGSSFLGFSILLFSFLRIDADRNVKV